jgi:hypothetical protein
VIHYGTGWASQACDDISPKAVLNVESMDANSQHIFLHLPGPFSYYRPWGHCQGMAAASQHHLFAIRDNNLVVA